MCPGWSTAIPKKPPEPPHSGPDAPRSKNGTRWVVRVTSIPIPRNAVAGGEIRGAETGLAVTRVDRGDRAQAPRESKGRTPHRAQPARSPAGRYLRNRSRTL